MLKIFIYLSILLYLPFSYSNFTCPSTRAVRLDVPKTHEMAPRNKRGKRINGNLNGVRVTDQMKTGNCYAHATALLYKSLSPRNPHFDPLALSSCLNNEHLTLSSGSIYRIAECNKGKRYCTLRKRDLRDYELQSIDNARSYIQDLSDADYEKYQKVLKRIISNMYDMDDWGDTLSKCLKKTPKDNDLNFSVKCQKKTKEAMKLLKSTKKLLLRLNKRKILKSDINKFIPLNDPYCVKTDLSKLKEYIVNIQDEYKRPKISLKLIRNLKKKALQEIDRILKYLISVSKYPNMLIKHINRLFPIHVAPEIEDSLKALGMSLQDFEKDANKFKEFYDPSCNQDLIKIEDLKVQCSGLNISDDFLNKMIPIIKPVVEWARHQDNGEQWLYNVLDHYNQNVYSGLNKCKGKRKVKFPDINSRIMNDNHLKMMKKSDDLKRKLLMEMVKKFRDDTKMYTFIYYLLKHLPPDRRAKYSTLANDCGLELIRRKSGRASPNICMPNITHIIQNELQGTDNHLNEEPIDDFISDIEDKFKDEYKEVRDTFSTSDYFRAKHKQKSDDILNQYLQNITQNRGTMLSVCTRHLQTKVPVTTDTKIKYYNFIDCGNHAFVAIGYKCVGNKLKVLIQNSWGSECSNRFSHQPSIECEKDPKTEEETGQFWIDYEILRNVLLGASGINP